jgi:hypothetical protein
VPDAGAVSGPLGAAGARGGSGSDVLILSILQARARHGCRALAPITTLLVDMCYLDTAFFKAEPAVSLTP